MAINREEIRAFFKKSRAAALVLLCGVFLMCLPGGKKETQVADQPAGEVREQTMEAALEEILSQVAGAGSVRVLLSGQTSEITRFQTDETGDGENLRQETVLITGDNRVQTALVRQTEAPTYRGAIIVCQGADSPAVRLAIVKAVAAATGLTTNRITVLKMK